MQTANKPTIRDVIKMAKQTGVVVSNIDVPAIISYINEFEPLSQFKIDYNYKDGKTVIIKK